MRRSSVVKGMNRKFFEGLPYPQLMEAVREVQDMLMARAAKDPARCRREYEDHRRTEERAIREKSSQAA